MAVVTKHMNILHYKWIIPFMCASTENEIWMTLLDKVDCERWMDWNELKACMTWSQYRCRRARQNPTFSSNRLFLWGFLARIKNCYFKDSSDLISAMPLRWPFMYVKLIWRQNPSTANGLVTICLLQFLSCISVCLITSEHFSTSRSHCGLIYNYGISDSIFDLLEAWLLMTLGNIRSSSDTSVRSSVV